MRRARNPGAASIGVETGDVDPANALFAWLLLVAAYRVRLWTEDL